MILALNIENTATALGGFTEKGMEFEAKLSTDLTKTADQYACEMANIFALNKISPDCVEGCIISSVVPSLTGVFKNAVGKLSGCTVSIVSTGVKTGLNIKLDNPKEVGSDRICMAVEAAATARLPCVIVALDTATTFTALDAKGVLAGSAIAPGIKTGLDALRSRAAQLPSIGLSPPENGVLGRNTVDAMKAGVLYGASCMIDGMLARYSDVLGEIKEVILTGEFASFVKNELHTPVILDEFLPLKGLYRIWLKNQSKRRPFSQMR